jgi:peroxiredoxin family protein
MDSDSEGPLSLVLFSGSDDKLTAAAVLTVGAAAMGRKVNLFLQYYALDAFRADRIVRDHGLTHDASPEQSSAVKTHPGNHWSELLRQAKDVGEVDVEACALSMEMFGLEPSDLDPVVDGVEGVAAFMSAAGSGQIVFI